jgi:hypothetical protein
MPANWGIRWDTKIAAAITPTMSTTVLDALAL